MTSKGLCQRHRRGQLLLLLLLLLLGRRPTAGEEGRGRDG